MAVAVVVELAVREGKAMAMVVVKAVVVEEVPVDRALSASELLLCVKVFLGARGRSGDIHPLMRRRQYYSGNCTLGAARLA